MHRRKFREIPSQSGAAARQFAEWRKTQKRGTRIPVRSGMWPDPTESGQPPERSSWITTV
jgi:hypothetical protein